MEGSIRISNFQLLSLVVIASIGTSSLYAPAVISQYAGRNCWYLVVVGGFVALFNMAVFLWLNRIYPDKNIIKICIHVLGPWLGSGVAALFIFFFMDVSSWVLREFSQFFIIALNPIIPQLWYLFAGVIMCAYAVFHGLEAFARVSEIIIFIMLATFVVIYLLLINQYHPEYLLPVMEEGLLKPLKGLMLTTSWFGDLMFVSMIIQHVRKTKHTVFYAFGAVGITVILLLMSVLSCTLLFGAETTATFTYPSVSLIQNIKLFSNIERFDAALVIVWVMCSFIKISVYFWSAIQGLSDLLRLRKPRMLIFPLAIGFVICSKFKVWGLIELATFYDKQAWYFVIFQLFIPVLLLLFALIKEKFTKKEVK
ncbi:GerAB/ArcD/ProY family transporter [Cohnella abietis]|uniref:Germination protein n=1 Tax=Cohnella abietis TaxID=2507935 RepID=A0A3T1DAA1_9BACL|nr:endospore germination permease [Cohnella abietis]BBI35046.1 germination protein [Cohnella abietis]